MSLITYKLDDKFKIAFLHIFEDLLEALPKLTVTQECLESYGDVNVHKVICKLVTAKLEEWLPDEIEIKDA